MIAIFITENNQINKTHRFKFIIQHNFRDTNKVVRKHIQDLQLILGVFVPISTNFGKVCNIKITSSSAKIHVNRYV